MRFPPRHSFGGRLIGLSGMLSPTGMLLALGWGVFLGFVHADFLACAGIPPILAGLSVWYDRRLILQPLAADPPQPVAATPGVIATFAAIFLTACSVDLK